MRSDFLSQWVTINNVYYNDTGEQYGYKICDENNRDFQGRRNISLDTAKQMVAKGTLKISDWSYLSYCTVSRDYKEDVADLL